MFASHAPVWDSTPKKKNSFVGARCMGDEKKTALSRRKFDRTDRMCTENKGTPQHPLHFRLTSERVPHFAADVLRVENGITSGRIAHSFSHFRA